jgi:hypothetical protein
MNTLFIGADGEQVVDSKETMMQIEEVKALQCDLVTDDGEPLTWDMFDNPDEPATLFPFIAGDRQIRVDQKTAMADRPPFAVITEHDGRCIRLEFYQGHDALELVHDVRSKDLQGADLPKWMEIDPHAHDPHEYLKGLLDV